MPRVKLEKKKVELTLTWFFFITERSSPENKWANRGPQKWSGPSNFIRGFIRMQTTGRTRSNTKTASFSEQLQHSSWISPNEKGKIRKFPYNLIYLFLFFMFWNLNSNFDMIFCLAYLDNSELLSSDNFMKEHLINPDGKKFYTYFQKWWKSDNYFYFWHIYGQDKPLYPT